MRLEPVVQKRINLYTCQSILIGKNRIEIAARPIFLQLSIFQLILITQSDLVNS